MTKSKLHKKRIIPLAIVLTLVILGIFNLNSVYAISWAGDGALFIPDDDWPSQYGAFVPQPNVYAGMSVDASNQGNYTMMDWEGNRIDHELVDFPGTDISELYPYYFDNYWMNSATNNNYTDPWTMINWMNVTTLNPHDITLSNYTVNSVFNYYVMSEWSTLAIPLNSSIPIQVDLMIDSLGPKILKLDWLTDDPSLDLLSSISLISPSGKLINFDTEQVNFQIFAGPIPLFHYYSFVAHEKGAWRLLMQAGYSKPTQLTLEFLDTPISTLSPDTLTYGGHDNDKPTVQEVMDYQWKNQWYKLNGEKGDLYRLDLGFDFLGGFPAINLWTPCDSGYIRTPVGPGVFDIYFPTTGSAYLSFIDETYTWWYRYSLYLSEFEVLNYTIGYEPFITKLSRDQRKAIEFEVEHDSFVRFNYTLFDKPLGTPIIYADFTNFGFLFEDAKKMGCYEVLSPLDTKTIGEETFYYYYMPNGTYKALLRNTDIQYEGVVQISSKYVDYLNDTIPITSLTYPDRYPSQFLTVGFQEDDFYPGIHQAQCVDIEITEPGQYRLNTTIYASDNLGGIPTETSPLLVIGYNATTDEYTDFTAEALSLDGNAFKAVYENTPTDHFYIAYTSKWHDMHFNLTQAGTVGVVSPYVWTGSSWDLMDITLDETDVGGWNLQNNGSIVLDIYTDAGNDFFNWQRGVGGTFDLPNINEGLYYWLDFECVNDYLTTRPFIDFIQLSNISLEGDINMVLVGESGYEYCNFWEPYIDPDLTDLFINQEAGFENDSRATWLFRNTDPKIIGLEEGTYKLLIIPYGFGYQGTLDIDFGISNFYSYRSQASYNITEEPNLYPYQIKSYNNTWYGPNNITIFSYGLTSTMNYTEKDPGGLFSNQAYHVVECFGEAYQWTQLVITVNNLTGVGYDLYIMQDLPWISNSGPNSELKMLLDNKHNTTVEFGALSDHFYLIFEYYGTGNNIVQFMLDLNQYDTTILTTSVPIGSYTAPPSPGLPPGLVLGLAIGIPVAAGVIVLIYVLRKKGRIGSKTP